MKEVWKPVIGYETHYQVSNLGRVKSIERTVTYKDGRVFNYPEKILTPSIEGRGYHAIKLSKSGRAMTHSLHKLIFEAFNGARSEGMVIDHIDNNPLNNRLDNLQQITQRVNSTKDSWRRPMHSKFVGVTKDKGKWRANITINGKKKFLGFFPSEQEASDAYQNALKTLL